MEGILCATVVSLGFSCYFDVSEGHNCPLYMVLLRSYLLFEDFVCYVDMISDANWRGVYYWLLLFLFGGVHYCVNLMVTNAQLNLMSWVVLLWTNSNSLVTRSDYGCCQQWHTADNAMQSFFLIFFFISIIWVIFVSWDKHISVCVIWKWCVRWVRHA